MKATKEQLLNRIEKEISAIKETKIIFSRRVKNEQLMLESSLKKFSYFISKKIEFEENLKILDRYKSFLSDPKNDNDDLVRALISDITIDRQIPLEYDSVEYGFEKKVRETKLVALEWLLRLTTRK